MTIEELRKEKIKAMKEKNTIAKEEIGSVIGLVTNAAIENKCVDNISAEMVDNALLKEIKTLKEMIAGCPLNRGDLKNEYEQRLTIIEKFAPQLTTDPIEIEKLVKSLGIELVAANRGAIMKALKGKVDMKTANPVVSMLLK